MDGIGAPGNRSGYDALFDSVLKCCLGGRAGVIPTQQRHSSRVARRICLVLGLNSHLSKFRDPKRSNWYSPGHSVGFSRAPLGQNLAGLGRSVGVNFDPLLRITLANPVPLRERISPEADSVKNHPIGTRSPRSLRLSHVSTRLVRAPVQLRWEILSAPIHTVSTLYASRPLHHEVLECLIGPGRKDSLLQGKAMGR